MPNFYYEPTELARTIVGPLGNLWDLALVFFPRLIAATAVFVLGLVIASGLGMLVERILHGIKLDKFFRNLGVEHYVHRAGLELNAARFVGQIVFWFFAIAFLLAASDLLGLTELSSFLRDILAYIPRVVVAVLIMLAAVLIGGFLKRVVSASVKSAALPSAHFLGTVVWWAVVIFGLLTMLSQLGIAPVVVNSIITGLIAMLALAGGLAFGLGGRDYASHLIAKLQAHTDSE